MKNIKDLPSDLIETIITNMSPTLNTSPISKLKDDFISAVRLTINNNPDLKRQTYIEGMVNSQVRQYYGGSLKFSIRNRDGHTISVYAPNKYVLSNPISVGNIVGIKGSLHVFDKSLSSGHDFLQLKADEIRNIAIVNNDYRGLIGYVDKHKRKKGISFFGKKDFKIALITSSQSEAISDIHNCLEKIKIFTITDMYVNLYNSEEISKAITEAGSSHNFDVIILARGGTENIEVFNEYCILNSIFKSNTLVISAIGHASNNPLSNIVADIAEDTPSSSARLLLYRFKTYYKNKSILIALFIIAFAILAVYFYFHLK